MGRTRARPLPALVPPLPASHVRLLRFSSAFPSIPSTTPIPSRLLHIASTLLAVQSQDADASLLSFWFRLPIPRPRRSDLAALLLRGSTPAGISRVWANRSTLQLVCASDRPLLSAAVLPQLMKGRYSALERNGLGAAVIRVFEHVQDEMRDWLKEGRRVNSADVDALVAQRLTMEEKAAGKRGRSQFTKEAVADAKRCIKHTAFVLTTAAGLAERVTSPDDGGRATIVQELDASEKPEIGVATMECARRYFRGYGPATETDFRYWLGVPAAQSKAAVRTLMDAGELEELATEDGAMLMVAGSSLEAVENCVRLVGRFEPVLLAHKDKGWIVAEDSRKRVWSKNADVAACVIVRGRIRGTWRKDGKDLRVKLFPDGKEGPLENGEVKMVFEKAREIAKGFYELGGDIVVEQEVDEEWVVLDEQEVSEEAGARDVGRRTRQSKRRKQS